MELPPAERRFYLYPEFAGLAVRGAAPRSPTTCSSGTGSRVLAGEAFGDDPAALCFRMATSLLYGDTDERKLEALAQRRPGGAAVDRVERSSGWLRAARSAPTRPRRRSRRGRGP